MTPLKAHPGWIVSVALALFLLGATFGVGSAKAAELVLFETPDCPWCKRWDAEVRNAYINSPEGRLAPLRRLDVSQSRRSGINLAAPIAYSPTFVLADNGREIGRITGYPGPDFFWSSLSDLLKRLPTAKNEQAQLSR